MKNKNLAIFQKYLEEHGFPCQWLAPTEDAAFERLIVDLGKDHKGRERPLLIHMIDYPLSMQKEDAEHAVQLFFAFPFRFQPNNAAELARLLAFYNNSFELPGLGMEEREQHIYFRYTFLKPNGFVQIRTFMAMVGAILLIADTLSDVIEDVAGGKSMKQALVDMVHAMA